MISRHVRANPRSETLHPDVNDNVPLTAEPAERSGPSCRVIYFGSVEVDEVHAAGRFRKYRSKRSMMEEALAKLKVRRASSRSPDRPDGRGQTKRSASVGMAVL